MDENKQHTDSLKAKTSVPEAKTSTDPEPCPQTVVENQHTKEKEQAHEEPQTPAKSRPSLPADNQEAPPDTTAFQDLLAAIGIRSGKNKQKASVRTDGQPGTDHQTDVPNTSPADTPCLEQNFLPTSPDELPLKDCQSASAGDYAGKTTDDCNGGAAQEGTESALASPEAAGPIPVKRNLSRKFLLIPLTIFLLLGGYPLYAFLTEPRPPSEDVVATYGGKNLTKEVLLTYIRSKSYKENQHDLCQKHGLDHSKCDQTEECETHPIDSLESYRQIVKMMAVQQMVNDWAKEKGITQKDNVQHDFKHLVEEVNLEKLVEKVHQDQLAPDKITKLEVQKYYEANKDTYKDKSVSEVENEIRNLLAAEKDKTFFPEYIARLKQQASLTVNYDLLRLEDPAAADLRKNEALFTIHGKPFTLGKFQEEVKELSPEIQAKLTGFETKKNLIDQLIAKELLLEETGDEAAEQENNKKFEDMKSQYLSQMLHKEEIDEKMGQISEEEAAKFYEEKKQYLLEPAKAQISLIRVDQGPSATEKAKARQTIDEALQKITSGADFAAIAKEVSSDSTAVSGGELKNWLYDTERLDQTLRKTIFTLQPEAVSGVFEYEGGYYIIKLRQKEGKRQRPFEEVKEQLKKALLDERHHEKEAALEAELLKKAQLVIYDSSLRSLLKEKAKTSI